MTPSRMALAFVLPLLALPSAAAVPATCVGLTTTAECEYAIGVLAGARGGALAVSVTGVSSSSGSCLQGLCLSIAVALLSDARATCLPNATCAAIAGVGFARTSGAGTAIGGCDIEPQVCYIRG